jgi:hypothetical protein
LAAALVGLLFGLPCLAIGPAGDDWFTAHPWLTFPWPYLVPQGAFWRPLEHVVYWLGGLVLAWHIHVCHLAAIFGHVASVAVLCLLLEGMGVVRLVAFLAAGLVALHPATAAAVWSVDSNLQTWSTAFGLLACLLALRGQKWSWLVAAIVASLWKESGTAWFVAVPMLRLTTETRRGIGPQKLRAGLRASRGWFATGLLGATVYFAARFALSGHLSLGAGGGRYAFGLDPLVWTNNAALLLGAVVVPADTVAILGRAHSLVAGLAPALLAVPFLAVVLRKLARSVVGRAVWPWLAFLMLLAVTAPHIFIGHVSEMYAHPLVLAITVPTCLLLAEQQRISARSASLLLVPLLLAFLIVDVSKYREMLATGRLGEVFARQNRAVAEPYRKSGVCFVPDDRGDWGRGYSVFQLDTAPAAGWGKAMVLEWGWDNYDKVVVDGLPSRCSPKLPRLRVGRDGLARSEEVPPAADRTRP